jgi:hypothetical protein
MPYRASTLEPKRETDIRGDRGGVIDQPVEKSPRLEAGEVECNDGVFDRGPPNLEISLIAEIAGMAGICWIDQKAAPKSIYPVPG